MDQELLKTFISSFIAELVKESKSIFQNLFKEGKQFLEIGLSNYLDKQKNKYSMIKTLLKGNSPVFLYDIYFPLKLTFEDKDINTNNISTLFKHSSFITIIGDAGSGKSTLVKHLFLNSIENKYAIPLIIELRYLNDYEDDIIVYIKERIFENEIAENSAIVERLLNRGKFVFFLDGYDELNSTIKQKVTNSMNNFITMYCENKFILTSRPYSNIEHFPMFHNMRIKQLSEREILEFIDKQLNEERELSDKIKKSIKETEDDYIKSFLTNPLLLSLYILTFQSYAAVPDKKYIFYRRVINALFAEHDSKTKLGFVREKCSGLTQEEFEELLKRFCFLSFFEGKYDYDVEYVNSKLSEIKEHVRILKYDNNKVILDLKMAIALWIEDNGIISFAHRSLQEYFAATFIKKLNEKNKETVYRKIKQRATFGRVVDIENVLSLCEEMDKVNYYKYYLTPLLKEIKEKLNNRSTKSLVRSFLIILIDEINYRKKRRLIPPREIKISSSSYRYFITSIAYFRNLYEEIGTIVHTRKFINFISDDRFIVNAKDKELYRINLNNYYEDDLYNFFLDSKLPVIATKYFNYINNRILEIEKYIEEANESDKELIDLI